MALISSQICQESCFDPNKISYAGTIGLMQVAPATGKSRLQKVKNLKTNPAGVKYSTKEGKVSVFEPEQEREYFSLASYTAAMDMFSSTAAWQLNSPRSRQRFNMWKDYPVLATRNILKAKYATPVEEPSAMRVHHNALQGILAEDSGKRAKHAIKNSEMKRRLNHCSIFLR
jgi:hypothetical protein